MMDIHTHILPDIDDGSATMDDAVDMARAAAKDGTTTMIATPHTNDGIYNSRKQDVLDGCRALNAVLVREKIPITILPGQEVHLTPEILENIDNNAVLTLNCSSYILIELPMHIANGYLPALISSIKSRGLIPVIAHPERNPGIMADPDITRELSYEGALFQMTAGSFEGRFGRNVKKCVERLAHMDMVDFIASDAHNTGHRHPAMSKGIKRFEKITGIRLTETIPVADPEFICS